MAAVLPTDHRRQRAAIAPVPADDAGTWGGEPRCTQRLARVDIVQYLCKRAAQGFHDLLGVMLDAVRRRMMGGDGAARGSDRSAAPIEPHCATGVTTLDEGEKQIGVPGWRRGAHAVSC